MQMSVFFHRGISRLRAEELLQLAGEDGSFLVRDSETVSNAYVLCVLFQLQVHQYRILPDKDGRLSVQSEGDMQPLSFTDLPSLVNVYVSKGEKNGLVCALRRPIPPERPESQEADSEEEDGDDGAKEEGAGDERSVTKNMKFGLLNNFARLDLSACDGEFIESLKTYIDSGLEQDAASTRSGSSAMLKLQELLQTAGRGLQREVDVFLMKLSMIRDVLAQDDDDRKRPPVPNINATGMNYIQFLAAQLEQSKTQLLDTLTRTEEMLSDASGNEYDYPDVAEVTSQAKSSFLLPHNQAPSVRIPLSTFEVKLIKGGKMTGPSKVNLNVDMRQGRLFAVKPSKDFLDSSNIFTHDKILQLVKHTQENSRLDVIMEGKKKLTYQFENAHERENFCLQVRQMKTLHSQETDVDNLSVFIGTWNMGKSTPINTLKFWLRCWGEGKSKDRTLSRLPHDVYVVGTQESSMADKDWVNLLKATLKATLMVDVDLLETCTLWGLRLVVLILPRHRNKISHVQKSSVRTGIANALGNKGAVAISFLFNGTSLCFINSHLTSGEEREDRRNTNFRDILKGLSLGPRNLDGYDVTHKFHHVFFFGDLNYRVAEPIESVLLRTEQRDLRFLLDKDQLKKAQLLKKAFVAFNETEISFMPTYRLERQTAGYKYDWRKVKKTGERINVPSWCDRILWHSFPGTFIENSAYGSVDNLLNSDHRPVFGSFVLGITSQFVQNRTSLQEDAIITLIFDTVEAQIRTSCQQSFILEFSSSCLPDIICCQPNKIFGSWQDPGMSCNPLWEYEELPELRPLFGDQEYLEDQHLLLAVKGADDDHESFGECILSLKGMFDSLEVQSFEYILTHNGEETGKIRGTWYVRCSDRSRLSRSRKTYEIIALDTEYHDPEEIHACAPRPEGHSKLHHTSSSSQMSTTTVDGQTLVSPPLPAPRPQPLNQVPPGQQQQRGEVVNGRGSTASSPPPIPNKRVRPILMGQSSLQSTQRQVTPVTAPARVISTPSAPPVDTIPPLPAPSQLPSLPTLPVVSPGTSLDAPPPISRKLKPASPGAVPIKGDVPCKLYDDLARPKTIQEWLATLGLTEYLSLFLRNGCDTIGSVANLTAAQVMKMGIKHPEHRTRILQSVHELLRYTDYTNQ
ncbi:phosphatidylinositol 3,4,5-trisphosphate 5-phosphatase 2-like isoform X2 [Pomacea canaliculata]|nr:phosphatidylinositol 3,4,5-trisphosphate 5-phosphatase 2-like isoform X2 [Pomacea canaliculata]XP_025080136.1 phosphatidylinositol 3,4,5-trisphosphate 5-phosphatase 2-like isoform X2 [Pomacea canaliculata]XP_025080137.1 phosphatidylinositol 3,4,5-trisphosphate 5-phosphatase 2-like isoform X2 [Pomacea canaliculata]